jgi:hypothetical protein
MAVRQRRYPKEGLAQAGTLRDGYSKAGNEGKIVVIC